MDGIGLRSTVSIKKNQSQCNFSQIFICIYHFSSLTNLNSHTLNYKKINK